MKLILASKSPRRRQLINEITSNVDFIENNVDETIENIDDLSPTEIAMTLASKKARGSIKSLNKESAIIGSDTIVVLGNKIFGKPQNEKEAFEMLRTLSGKTHSVITGVSILMDDNNEDLFYEETKVNFNNLNDEMIKAYIDTGDPFDKAGSYGIQSMPEGYIESIIGDYDNVVGLPVKKLRKHLFKNNLINE